MKYVGPADERDLQLLANRQLNYEMRFDNRPEPVEGDVIQFPDGSRRRVAHVWRTYKDRRDAGVLHSVQPADRDGLNAGSVHFSESGYMSYSGSLADRIAGDTFTFHGETVEVPVWIFHHDVAGAHRSVAVTATVKVWDTTAAVPA